MRLFRSDRPGESFVRFLRDRCLEVASNAEENGALSAILFGWVSIPIVYRRRRLVARLFFFRELRCPPLPSCPERTGCPVRPVALTPQNWFFIVSKEKLRDVYPPRSCYDTKTNLTPCGVLPGGSHYRFTYEVPNISQNSVSILWRFFFSGNVRRMVRQHSSITMSMNTMTVW